MAEINVVPYIDVMLVLLIIFMVAAPMIQQGLLSYEAPSLLSWIRGAGGRTRYEIMEDQLIVSRGGAEVQRRLDGVAPHIERMLLEPPAPAARAALSPEPRPFPTYTIRPTSTSMSSSSRCMASTVRSAPSIRIPNTSWKATRRASLVW